jgi:hypothetical protein
MKTLIGVAVVAGVLGFAGPVSIQTAAAAPLAKTQTAGLSDATDFSARRYYRHYRHYRHYYRYGYRRYYRPYYSSYYARPYYYRPSPYYYRPYPYYSSGPSVTFGFGVGPGWW